MKLLAAPLAIVLLGLATACGSSKDDASATEKPAFEGVPWILAGGIDVPGWQKVAPSAEFANGVVGGSNGCNHYTAGYTVDGDSLTIEPVASTQMACPPPGDAVEKAYGEALGKVAGWKLESSKLVLTDSDDAELLTYTQASPIGTWEATTVQTGDALVSPLADAPISAGFGNDGSLIGSGGCNAYTATFSTGTAGISISPPVATRKLCTEPKGVMELEAAYLAALPTATHFRVDGKTLSLLRADGTFVAAYTRK